MRLLTPDDSKISQNYWISIQVKPNEIFQLMNNSTECRLAKVFPNGVYSISPRANADRKRASSALVKVTSNQVLVIAGSNPSLCISLPTVSSYDFSSNIWSGGLPPLNTARIAPSACVLSKKVYVFCGGNYSLGFQNSIEVISVDSLVPQSAGTWNLIELPKNIFTERARAAVSPINDTEITIFGGNDGGGNYLSEIFVFNTTTFRCDKMSDGDLKFCTVGNQCA